jgi:hypothetical protein
MGEGNETDKENFSNENKKEGKLSASMGLF